MHLAEEQETNVGIFENTNKTDNFANEKSKTTGNVSMATDVTSTGKTSVTTDKTSVNSSEKNDVTTDKTKDNKSKGSEDRSKISK